MKSCHNKKAPPLQLLTFQQRRSKDTSEQVYVRGAGRCKCYGRKDSGRGVDLRSPEEVTLGRALNEQRWNQVTQRGKRVPGSRNGYAEPLAE
jgi:hypothetical protein